MRFKLKKLKLNNMEKKSFNVKRQTEFFNTYQDMIIDKCVLHKNELGFVRVGADHNFQPVNLEFVAEKFDPSHFIKVGEPEQTETPPMEVFYCYFVICWYDTETVWRCKEIVRMDLADGNDEEK